VDGEQDAARLVHSALQYGKSGDQWR
jgi:hypothetical protein